jgi:hypothetical protein
MSDDTNNAILKMIGRKIDVLGDSNTNPSLLRTTTAASAATFELDEPQLLDNLMNESGKDTAMEAELKRQISQSATPDAQLREWTTAIRQEYATASSTGNFDDLVSYIRRIPPNEIEALSLPVAADVDEYCYFLVKYLRHTDFGVMSESGRDKVTELGVYFILVIFARRMQWKKGGVAESGFQVILDSLETTYSNGVKARLTVEELRTVGDGVDTLNGDLTIHNDSLKRARGDADRMGIKLRAARLEMWSMLALVLTVNSSFLALHYRRHAVCRKYAGWIMLFALACMVALSIRTVVYTTSVKETFVTEVPTSFQLAVVPVMYRKALDRERVYTNGVLTSVMNDTEEQKEAAGRQRVIAEHMYSSYRFKERQTYRASGVVQLAFALTLIIILIVLTSKSIGTVHLVAMYAVVLALVAVMLAFMYRTDGRRMRTNWEKVYH